MCIVKLNLVFLGGQKLKEVKLLIGEVRKYIGASYIHC